MSVAVPCTCPAEELLRTTMMPCRIELVAACARLTECAAAEAGSTVRVFASPLRVGRCRTPHLQLPLWSLEGFRPLAVRIMPFHRTPKDARPVAAVERRSTRAGVARRWLGERKRDYAVACGGRSAEPPPRSAREQQPARRSARGRRRASVVCVLCVLTAEKRRVLSRVRRGALYLSRRRAPRVEMNVPKTEFAGRNTHAERTPLSSRRDQLARHPL